MPKQEKLFGGYLDELRDAHAQALAWWARLEDRVVALGSDAASTDEMLRPYLPMGPASHPRVLQVLRVHAAALAGRNDEQPPRRSHERKRLADHLRTAEPKLGAFLEDLLLFPEERPLPDLPEQPESALEQPRAFRFEVQHAPGRGIERLMGASRLMPGFGTGAAAVNTLTDASIEHRRLFYAYERHLEAALSIAEVWWATVIVTTRARREVKPLHAAAHAFDQYFAGPAVCPELQWTIHRYWTQCMGINARSRASRRVPPESLLLTWLQDDNHPGWLEAVSCLPYWPIGLDGAGRWQ